MSKCRICIAAMQHYIPVNNTTSLFVVLTGPFRDALIGPFLFSEQSRSLQKEKPLRLKNGKGLRSGHCSTLQNRTARRGSSVKQTSSLRLSLAAKPNDDTSVKILRSESVTFSTGRYRFDINRIAIMSVEWVAPEHAVFSLKLCNGGTNEILLSDIINFGTFRV